MISNLIIFFFGTFSISFLADITRRNDNKKLTDDLSSIIRLYHYLIFIFLFLSSIFINFYGEFIYKVWLKDINIIFNKELLKLLLISTILTVFNTSNSNILISTNNHVKFSIINIIPTGIFILTSFYLLNKFSLIGAVYAIIIFEIMNLVVINYLLFNKLKNIKNLFIKNLLIFLFLLSLYLINHIYLLIIIILFLIFSFKYFKEIYIK
jgi:O-antigen/teichoic acid export membrane protein